MTALLEKPTLVLNSRWVPIRTTPMKEAIGLVAKGAAKIVEPETYATHDLMSWNDVSKAKAEHANSVIRSVNLALVPLDVIVLTGYEGMGERQIVFSRKNLFKRDHYTCMYCGVQPGPEELTVDHVLPRAQGGISSFENCVLACVPCNSRKANRTPEQANMKLRKVPKKPSWKIMVQVAPRDRKQSWEQFLGEAYWNIELQP